MIGKGTSVRAPWGDDDPNPDGYWIPAVVLGDLPRDPTTDIHGRHQIVDVDDPRLQFDHEEDPRRRVPGNDINDASLAVCHKGDLGQREPSSDVPEPPEHGLVHQCVAAIYQSVQVGAAPAEHPLEPSIEDTCHSTHVAERNVIQAAGFDPHDDPTRDSCGHRDIRLSKPPAEPKGSECRADALVLHRGSLAGQPYLRLTGCRFEP